MQQEKKGKKNSSYNDLGKEWYQCNKCVVVAELLQCIIDIKQSANQWWQENKTEETSDKRKWN